jgi:hypothetical protein
MSDYTVDITDSKAVITWSVDLEDNTAYFYTIMYGNDELNVVQSDSKIIMEPGNYTYQEFVIREPVVTAIRLEDSTILLLEDGRSVLLEAVTFGI